MTSPGGPNWLWSQSSLLVESAEQASLAPGASDVLILGQLDPKASPDPEIGPKQPTAANLASIQSYVA